MSKVSSWEVTDDFWRRAQALIPPRQREAGKDRRMHDWCSRALSMYCARAVSGKRCLPSVLAAPAQSMPVFCIGNAQAF
jgi:transposase